MYKILVRCQGRTFGLQESYLREDDKIIKFNTKEEAYEKCDKLNSKNAGVNTFIQYFVVED